MNKDCRHIKTNGRKCGSPAARGEYYGYSQPRRLRAAWAVKPPRRCTP